MIKVYKGELKGYTVARRSNGDRCVYWTNGSLEWFTSAEFDILIGA